MSNWIEDFTDEKCDRLLEANITLNGNRAVIKHTQDQFPTVMDLTTRMGAEFSWYAIENVITKHNGAFRS